MVGAGIDRAILSETPPSPPTVFSPKEEPPKGKLHQRLQTLGVGAMRIITSDGERMLYSRDQSEIPRFMKDLLFSSCPDAVVQAESPEVVLELLRLASEMGLPVIPRGSGSSPFGGSVPVTKGLVIDTSRMDKVLRISPESKTVTVHAGARWADIDHALSAHGLQLLTSPSSKFSTVGGWIATGGMGINSLSKGHLSSTVLSLDLATPRGEILGLGQEDSRFPLVFGSEGQLGIVTTITLKVQSKPRISRPHLVIFDANENALRFAESLVSSNARPAHIVVESSLRVELTNKMLDAPRMRAGHAVLVSIEDEASEKSFVELLKKNGVKEEKEYLARYLWNERFFPMKIRRFGPGMLGTEVIAARSMLPKLMAESERLCAQLDLDPMFEVHFLPDGDALILCFFTTDQGNTIRYTLDAFKSLIVAKRLLDLGARPYSVGIWNHPFSGSEDRARKDALRSLKSSTDPRGVMNPGKYFRLSGRWAGLGGLAMHPMLMGTVLKAFLALTPVTTRVLHMLSSVASDRFEPSNRDALIKTADECAMCGSCVSVCPAYLIVGDERVTARGKLMTAKAMNSGASISKEHAQRIFLCMRCKACEQVCQSKLELLPAYDELERRLEAIYSKDTAEIERFVKFAEASAQYEELLQKGLVVGAPKNIRGGDGNGL